LDGVDVAYRAALCCVGLLSVCHLYVCIETE